MGITASQGLQALAPQGLYAHASVLLWGIGGSPIDAGLIHAGVDALKGGQLGKAASTDCRCGS